MANKLLLRGESFAERRNFREAIAREEAGILVAKTTLVLKQCHSNCSKSLEIPFCKQARRSRVGGARGGGYSVC